MKCFKCGAEVPAGKMSCEHCGAMISGGTVSGPGGAASRPSMGNEPWKPEKAGGPGFGIASMVLGIVSLALFCVFFLSLPCAIVGVALGGYGIYRGGAGKGQAIAGVTCSIVALGIVVIFLAADMMSEIFWML